MIMHEVFILDRKITFELRDIAVYTIEMINTKFNKHFSNRSLQSEIILEFFDFPINRLSRRLESDLKKLRWKLRSLITLILCRLRERGFIKKHSHLQWEILRFIDVDPDIIIKSSKGTSGRKKAPPKERNGA